MCETIAKIVVALNIVMTVSLFIYQVKTTKKVGQNRDPCAKEYKDCCMNEGECFCYVDENNLGSFCPPLYGGKRCEKFLQWYKER